LSLELVDEIEAIEVLDFFFRTVEIKVSAKGVCDNEDLKKGVVVTRAKSIEFREIGFFD